MVGVFDVVYALNHLWRARAAVYGGAELDGRLAGIGAGAVR